jgi:transcription elongation GreA/GreB family factor
MSAFQTFSPLAQELNAAIQAKKAKYTEAATHTEQLAALREMAALKAALNDAVRAVSALP